MENYKNMKTVTLILLGSLICLKSQSQVVHELSSNSHVKEFLIAGPFHQEGLAADDWVDLLETEFINNENSPDPFPDGQIAKAEDGRIDIKKLLEESEVALAYTRFKVSAEKSTGSMFQISASDGAKIFVNGKHMHTFFGGGWNDPKNVTVPLNEGENDVVIKVANRDWGWDLSVKILEPDEAAEYLEDKEKEDQLFAFYHSELIPKPSGNFGYTFYPGRFPDLIFENPVLVEQQLGGGYSLSMRWFDRDLNEVIYPAKPGKYAYYAEITGANGMVLKKSATLFCAPQNWMGWTERLSADLEYFPVNGAAESVWSEHDAAINQMAGFAVFESIMRQKKGAALQAFIDDMNRDDLKASKVNTPIIRDGDYHARLKQKLLGVEGKYPELKAPKMISDPAPTLEVLPEKEARKYRKLTEELILAGNNWMNDEGGPFDMVIAKDGKILFHESFGENLYGKFTTETPSEIASITKLMTGMLFAQFVDQGIIGIDDLVGQYLPEFPLEGPNAVTLRHCFTHTAGFDFFAHGIYGGAHNPWLENTLLLTLEGDTVGKQLWYNGMGYDLAGKVMEVVAGKSIFRLLREYIYDPLEMDNTEHDWDLGYSIHSTAHDLAKVAQMILNKGSYGNLQFFSEETYEKLIPADLDQFYPDLRQKWGIGFTVMDWKVKDEDTDQERFLVSEGIIGHGSATASIFWIIPRHNMIITQSRRRGNRNFAPNYIKMMEVVEKHLIGQ